MNLIKLTAPLAALTLLTAACGPFTKTAGQAPARTPSRTVTPTDPVPAVSPSGGPSLQRVWQVPASTVNVKPSSLRFPAVAGNIVVAQATGKQNELVFIDGTTGRVTGRVSGLKDVLHMEVDAAADKRGHPLVQLSRGEFDDRESAVYEPTGRLVWRSKSPDEQFVGGYVAETSSTGKKFHDAAHATEDVYKTVIRTLSGHVVGHVTLADPANLLGAPTDLQFVRPGWLVMSSLAGEVYLIDLTRPNRARVRPARLPFSVDSYSSPDLPRMRAGNGHVYVAWSPPSDDEHSPAPIARYDPPRTQPVWNRLPPRKAIGSHLYVYPGPDGGDTVKLEGGEYDSRYWFIRPATGTPIGPRAGLREDLGEDIDSAYGRYAYQFCDGITKTKAIDLRPGKKRTIDAQINGITTNGYLIGDGDFTLAAYRWTNWPGPPRPQSAIAREHQRAVSRGRAENRRPGVRSTRHNAVMRWLLCAAPLAALVLLAGACGIDDDDQPGPIPWDGAPGLEQVWQAGSGRGHVGDAQVAGNVVVAYEASVHNSRWVFLDGMSGRVMGLPAGLTRMNRVRDVYATTDAGGRPLVALYQDRGRSFDQRVYTPGGQLVWAGRSDARFAGGYVAEPRTTAHRVLIRTPFGKVVARLPMADFTGYDTDVLDDVPGTDYGLDLRLVRPGLLVASGIGAGRSGIALVDVSRPGHAKVSMLRTPNDPDHIDGVRIAVAGGHVYATWPGPGLAPARYVARYDGSGTRPIWLRPVPAGATGLAGIRAFTDPKNGATTVTFTVTGSATGFANGDDTRKRYWLLRPDTGAPYGPRAGRGGDPIGAYGGRVYSRRDDITREIVTDAVDQRTGKVQRIHGVVEGVTTNGYVIGGPVGGPDTSVNAYTWE